MKEAPEALFKRERRHSFCSVGSDELDAGIDSGSDEDLPQLDVMNGNLDHAEEDIMP